jgi:squalene-hopene/tetraprenyl-beta-curcumene cyclase
VTCKKLDETLERLTQTLLDDRNDKGYWEGELSSSALSTATGIIALHLKSTTSSGTEREQLESLVQGGLQWLSKTQNEDGGFGDTILSFSNISTTALCWASLCICDREQSQGKARREVEAYVEKTTGGLDPESLQKAIIKRYGSDHTFSVPILMTLALAGRLGEGKEGWKRVPQLPFQLAAFPKKMFRWLKLPVVSYAIPALIAIGQVRHYHCPHWNPFGRLARDLTVQRTLNVLASVQPENGGFLEATPLTSFVTMSLLSCGLAEHSVVKKGVAFLIDSVREDGSWPIDTNLATWVTTLSVKALAEGADFGTRLPREEKQRLYDWILHQQYLVRHPYTDAPMGGWAWTDLPGGVPDADDTAGALVALRQLGTVDEELRKSAELGVLWLKGLQNGDGGVATFCRGWGTLPFDRSSQDLTAHAILAWTAWKDECMPVTQSKIHTAIQRGLRYLKKQQGSDGRFCPLWFGNQYLTQEENPLYGTARVLIALNAVTENSDVQEMKVKAELWVLSIQNADGGWGGDKDTPSSLEETALAIDALASNEPISMDVGEAIERAVAWIVQKTELGHKVDPSPIGFYFAKLWYFEKLYPLSFLVSALGKARRVLLGNMSPNLAP